MPALLVTDSKYKFVPPHEGNFLPRVLSRVMAIFRRRKYCVDRVEIRGEETLAQLVKSGHGILLAPNHSRMTDAMVLQDLAMKIRQPFFIMASSHLFRGSKTLAWMLRGLGAFSVYREGIDRQAIQKSIDILSEAQRPLVLFPEGALSQANDHLNSLQEGFSFIARSAAAKIERSEANGSGRKIYTLPVGIRYVYEGDIEHAAGQMLGSIEQRLSWKVQQGQCLVTRIYRVGNALLSLKEQEYLGQSQQGELEERLERLINHLLVPLEQEWLGGPKTDSVILRVKELRRAIMPAMVDGNLAPEEMARRWKHLDDSNFAQSLSLYPARYVASNPTSERILETVERFNEHLNGDETPHGPMKAIVQIGEPIEVPAKRDRTAKSDPLLAAVEQQLTKLLGDTAKECHPYTARGK
ncbi:MAG: 1-acyl-sn-glycerol-3-phosphate acyltransferase [Planctomycetaceae bacterium]|nr:1-acyl-sn-glycerol-3-phosphate acyltransferase [Planctomycetaceae bacterium]